MSTLSAKLQKSYEREHLKYFLDADIGKTFLNDNDIASVTAPLDGCEPLDFIAYARNGKKIGIEVTNIVLFLDNHFRSAIDSNLNAVLNHIYKELRNIFAIVAYYPNPINPSSKMLKKEDLKKLFANRIRSFDEDFTNGIVASDKWEHINVGGDNEILLRFTIDKNHFCVKSSYGGSFIVNPYSKLQDCIAKKQSKHDSYLDRCDECILLVVSDFTMSNSSPILFEDLENQVFECTFSKIFLLELASLPIFKITELNLRRTSPT